MPEIVKTADGSDTLFNELIGENYHSTFGALQESMHIFINTGLKIGNHENINLLEVGFGTGLNAYLTLLESILSGQKIRYITIEKYPLPASVWSKLNYPAIIPSCNPELFRLINEATWNEEVKITENFTLLKLSCDLNEVDFSVLPAVDLIYFDAFSPEKQPDLWKTSVFQKLSNQCSPMARIVTYCAKGVVRRSMIESGFVVERIPGPPGKREILRGTKSPKTAIPE